MAKLRKYSLKFVSLAGGESQLLTGSRSSNLMQTSLGLGLTTGTDGQLIIRQSVTSHVLRIVVGCAVAAVV